MNTLLLPVPGVEVPNLMHFSTDNARLAQYTEEGYVVQFCVLCNDVYDGLEWVRENVCSKGIAIYGKELRAK